MRAALRGISRAGGYYACDICEAKAVGSQNLTKRHGKDRTARGTSRVWPKSTLGGQLRTHARILNVGTTGDRSKLRLSSKCFLQIANDLDVLDDDERVGVNKKTLLAELPGFDLQEQLIPELQHTLDLGTTKLLAGATFQGSAKRARTGIFDRVNPKLLNEELDKVKVSSE